MASEHTPVRVEQIGTGGRTAAERIGVARQVVETFWRETSRGYSDTDVTVAERRLGITLPAVLREGLLTLLASSGLNQQDRFFAPSALEPDGRHLTFRIENQGCAKWAVRLDDVADDPHIWISSFGGEWRRDVGTLSSFFVFAALSEAMFAPPFDAFAEADDEHVRQLESSFAALDVEPFEFWPGPDVRMRFFGAADTLIADTTGWLYATCLSAAALQRVMSLITADWEPTSAA